MNQKFLKEAIADAKTIKEAAIANAKLSLEESFTPHIKELLSTKLQEMEDEDLKEAELQNEVAMDDEEINLNEIEADLDENQEETETEKIEETKDEEKTEDETEETEEAEDMNIEDMSKEDLAKFIEATVSDMVSKGEIEMTDETESETEETAGEEELDLETTDDETLNETEDKVEEVKVEESEKVEETSKVAEMKKELFEAYATVKSLKTTLNEVNLLNAKLLYVNKIFKAKTLNEAEKEKVVNAFEKAKTVNETKIVFDTLVEGFLNKPKTKTSAMIKESMIGASSKSISPIKESQKPIIDSDPVFAKMKRLAGL